MCIRDRDYNPPAILPIQIAYYAGLRIGEACGLAWQDVNLEEQCLTIRRSIRYDGSRHKNIIGPTKRKKVRIVDFGDTLAEILRNARKEQLKSLSLIHICTQLTMGGILSQAHIVMPVIIKFFCD